MKSNLFQRLSGQGPRWSFDPGGPRTRYLVYYDGSLAALAALKAAMRMAEPGTEFTALSFIATPAPAAGGWTDTEERAQAAAAAAVANAALAGVRIKTEIARGKDAGPELLNRARRDGATIFLGVDHADGADVMDPLADYVLRHANSQVVLVRL